MYFAMRVAEMNDYITIYHGSDHIIREPEFGFGKRYNDYGMGFYCTREEKMACEWAVSKNRDGYVNAYDIDMTEMKVLELNSSAYTILHWLTILLENRTLDIKTPIAAEAKKYLLSHFKTDYESKDIIVGYRADDSYFSFAEDFLNNTISYRQLEKAMLLGNLGEQIVLKSEKAFQRLNYQNSIICETGIWYPKKVLRDRNVRKDYFDLEKNTWQKGDIYVMQIIEEEMKADDLRLR